MQVGDTLPDSPIEDVKSSRNLRKSSRIHDVRHAPTSSPMLRTKGEDLSSPGPASPRPTRKRVASLEVTVGDGDTPDYHNSASLGSPQSATSVGSGEFSPHVCLCQPEPKIPRPRNGEYSALVFRLLFLAWVVRLSRTKNFSLFVVRLLQLLISL